MKRIRHTVLGIALIIYVLAMTACTGNYDNAVYMATEKEMQEVTGHWLAEIPISGETLNWRSEEGEMTTYDHIDALVYLNGWDTSNKGSYWGYVYMKDGDMVNYDGIDRSKDDRSGFDFTMDSDGNITPNSHVAGAPKVTDMHWAGESITANVSYKGHTVSIVFHRPTDEEEDRLNDVFEMLLDEGIIGGYDDGGSYVDTNVGETPATKPSRAPELR